LNSENFAIASFEDSLPIGKVRKRTVLGKNFYPLHLVSKTDIVDGINEADEMRKFPLLNIMVPKRISEISEDQREQLILLMKESCKFPVQPDESTEITNEVNLLALAHCRYI